MAGRLSNNRWLHGALTLGMVALVVYYARTVHWDASWRAIRSASPWLLFLAALANLATLAAKAVVWWIFLRPVGAPSLGLAMRATAAGAGINNLLIANSGEAARAVLVTRSSAASGTGVVAALALERLFDFIGYVLVLIGAAFLLPLPESIARWRPEAVAVLGAIVVVLIALLAHAPHPPPADQAITGTVARMRAGFERFMERLAHIVTLRRMGAALVLTVVNWGTQIASYHLTAVAAHFPISIGGSITAMLLVNVGFLARATPGNVGFFQFAYAATAQAMGLSKDAAVGVALLLQLVQNGPVTVLGAALAPDLVLSARKRKAAGAGARADGAEGSAT
ncbi:MAG TPA: lysylphosphatidylglycerol synthase transmembrane domain-containing protein [Rhodanobacteraceae bacterium]|nr:lysylphosphatidylglycerol synthase transmembrane domain-containing protein [Gemmatimonadaceae bacterium]